ncbi:MAG: methylated-DNA--[protein]-cysteine S-methyltransferase [Desulfobacterales bacterium]|jgi:AraC family transcriptional regulator of adaptative response/methylated-DNA-[protein]-cysteine methyltransferase|nr:methylated-DNA--[protein]-cysteine S-methyltransferase [Desulfobacterales bacterium]
MDLSEHALWQGVLKRDSRYDGICFYGVISTFIYCRLHCSSKKPKLENVRFFFAKESAEKAGFRPCRRCRPDQAEEPGTNEIVSKILAVCRYIESCDYAPSLKELSQKVNLSSSHLQRVFKKALGVSPRNYADVHRQVRLKKALKAGDDVTLATYEAGYGSSSRLYEISSRYLGMTPKTYKENGKGQKIYYAVVKCPLGLLLLAATQQGICSVRIGDSHGTLVDGLKSEFNNAEIAEADSKLSEWAQMLIDYLAGSSPWPALPFDVKATAFQRKVWDRLRTIPEGQTMSYSEIAASIGQPKAARAVARACATNPVALVIPCHRVVPKTKGTGGYRWGAERKRKLLAIEKQKGLP